GARDHRRGRGNARADAQRCRGPRAGRADRARTGVRRRMTDAIPVRIKRLPHGEGLDLPRYATEGAAGMDVLSAEDVTIASGARHAVATGLAVAIPAGYEIQVRPRSGLALKHGISVPNAP